MKKCLFTKPVMLLFYRDAWHNLGEKSRVDCMLEYVNRLLEIDEEWEEKVSYLQYQ